MKDGTSQIYSEIQLWDRSFLRNPTHTFLYVCRWLMLASFPIQNHPKSFLASSSAGIEIQTISSTLALLNFEHIGTQTKRL